MSWQQLAPLIRDAVEVLDRHAIPYYIGGSVASSIYSHPRSTLDVDIGAAISANLITELAGEWSQEFYCSETAMRDAVSRGKSFNLVHNTTQLKADIFVVLPNTFNAEVLKRRVRKCLATRDVAIEAWLATPEDILIHKLKWYRLGGEASDQQWKDIRNLIDVKGPILDVEYVQRWSKELGVDDLWRHAWDQRFRD